MSNECNLHTYRKNDVPGILSESPIGGLLARDRIINSAVRHSVYPSGYIYQIAPWFRPLAFVPRRSQSSDCFYPAAGYRNNSSGDFNNVGNNGYYWSASPTGTGSINAGNLNFNRNGANTADNNNRANGFSVRCVQAFILFFQISSDCALRSLFNYKGKEYNPSQYRKNDVPGILSESPIGGFLAGERIINSVVRHEVLPKGYIHQLMYRLKSLAFVPVHSQSSDCFYPAAGLRNNNSGDFGNVGNNGYYWSASPNGTGSNDAGNLNFSRTGANTANNNNRANGFSVRCVQAFIPFFLQMVCDYILCPIFTYPTVNKNIMGYGCSLTKLVKNDVPGILSVPSSVGFLAGERIINSAVRHTVYPSGYAYQIVFRFGPYVSVPFHSQPSDCLYPAAGLRNNNSGDFGNVGQNGYYWSASPTGTSSNNAGNLNLDRNGANTANNNNRSNGFSVRCVQAFIASFFQTVCGYILCPFSAYSTTNNNSIGYECGFIRLIENDVPGILSESPIGGFLAGERIINSAARHTVFPSGYSRQIVFRFGLFASVPLHFQSSGCFNPAAGRRNNDSGDFVNVGQNGYYWSASPTGTSSNNAGNLNLDRNGANTANNNNRSNGFSVRCVQAFIASFTLANAS